MLLGKTLVANAVREPREDAVESLAARIEDCPIALFTRAAADSFFERGISKILRVM